MKKMMMMLMVMVVVVYRCACSSEPYVFSLLNMNVRTPYSCHELFGFDIMLDEKLRPWLLEVNISPRWDTHTCIVCMYVCIYVCEL